MYVLKDKEKLEYFKSIVPGHYTKEIIDLYYKKYGEVMSKWKVDGLKKTYKLKSNVDARFKKGEKHGGQIPSVIGARRKNERGFWLIKVAQPNVWKREHIYIWEKEYGKLSKDKCLVFLDGNKDNVKLKNLKAVKRREQLLMSRINLFAKNKDITETGIKIAQVINKTNEIKNNY